jgi:hypothetical protein
LTLVVCWLQGDRRAHDRARADATDNTADYGNCAVYRLQDLREFAKRLSEVRCTSSFNFTVPMDTPEDRWISLIAVEGESAPPDIAHLKLAIGDSRTPGVPRT